jgi:hypothetical protein
LFVVFISLLCITSHSLFTEATLAPIPPLMEKIHSHNPLITINTLIQGGGAEPVFYYTTLILDHPLYRNHRVQLSHADNFYNVGVANTEALKVRVSNVPVVLAAQRNDFLIFQLLKLRGARVVPVSICTLVHS